MQEQYGWRNLNLQSIRANAFNASCATVSPHLYMRPSTMSLDTRMKAQKMT